MSEWHDGIDTAVHRGLEIGALHNPRFATSDPNVFFVDHTDTESLRRKYAQDQNLADHLESLVEVDFVWGGDDTLLQHVVKEAAPFDFVYASHVFEHLPNPVGWLQQIETILSPDGIVSLVIPDKRFCFDINRRETEISDVVEGYLCRATRPTYQQIYDFHSKIVAVDTARLWSGDVDYQGVWREDKEPDLWAMELCQRSAEGEYIDSHCGVYTPASFLQIIEKLARLGLLGFRIDRFQPTGVNSLEFRVVLQKLPAGLPVDARKQAIDSSVSAARAGHGIPADAGQQAPNQPLLGPRELALIARKRAAVDALHRIRSRLRRMATAAQDEDRSS